MLVPNGCVGDWRLSDDDAFMDSFQLPTPAQKLESLRKQYAFPREARIHFDEATHTYTIDGSIVVPRSVTKLLHQFSNDFAAQIVLSEMRARESWEWKQDTYLTDDDHVMTNEQITARWSRNGLVQRSRGTLLHYHVEQHLNGAVIEPPHSPEFQQFLQLHEEIIIKNFSVYRTEISLFHVGLKVAGQADCLCRDGHGNIVIWDWKRSKDIRTDSRDQMKAPLLHLPDCNYYHYALQLNMYQGSKFLLHE